MFPYRIFVFICFVFFVAGVRSDATLRPCISVAKMVDMSIAQWRKSPLNEASSEIEYQVCGNTFTVFSYLTHATLSVEMHGVNVYSYSKKIREPSTQDINPNTYCFDGVLSVDAPYIDWPSDTTIKLSFFESGKEPLLHLCSTEK
jgi:hypothetical protein